MTGCELHIDIRVYESIDFIFLNSGNIAVVRAGMGGRLFYVYDHVRLNTSEKQYISEVLFVDRHLYLFSSL